MTEVQQPPTYKGVEVSGEVLNKMRDITYLPWDEYFAEVMKLV